APRWPQFVLTAGLVVLQITLALSGRLGYGAQLTLGLNSPTDVLGVLTTVAPTVSVMLLLTALRAQHRVYIAGVMAVSEALALSLTGFRGAAATLVVAIIFAAALTLPKGSPWRRPHRATIVTAGLAVVAVAGFIIA